MIPNWVDTGDSCRSRTTTSGRGGTSSPSASSSCTRATSATRRTSTRSSARRRSCATSTISPVVIIGFGARRAELRRADEAARGRQGRASCPYQPREVLSQSLSTADVHVVGLARGLSGYVVPSRLYGILAAGRPVIVAADAESETAQLVTRGRLRRRRPAGRPVRCSPRRSARRTTASTTSRRWAGERAPTRRRRPTARSRCERYRAVIDELQEAGASRLRSLFWASLGALVWTHARLPARGRRARAGAAPRRSARRRAADRDADRRRARRGGGDRAAARRTCSRSTIRADRLELVVASDASDRPHRRAGRGGRGACARAPLPARREGRGAEPRRARDSNAEVVAFSDANATWAPDALRRLVALVRRPRRRLRLRAARADRRGRRLEPGGRLLALRDLAARAGVGARLGHRRQRLDLRGAALGLRRGRPAVRPRPVAAVPDGAARPACGLRAGGDRVREADAARSRPSTGARCACSSTAG